MEANTQPIGVETIVLDSNRFNAIGMRLQLNSVARGGIEAVSTDSITVSLSNFDYAGKLRLLRPSAGAGRG